MLNPSISHVVSFVNTYNKSITARVVMDAVIQDQNSDEVLCISHNTHILAKDINSAIDSPAMDKYS